MSSPISFNKAVTRVEWNEAELSALKRGRWVREELMKEGRKVLREARARAPVSETGSDGRPPGYLRSQIKLYVAAESVEGPAVVVKTTAKSARGFRYGAYWQRRRPYIRAGTSL